MRGSIAARPVPTMMSEPSTAEAPGAAARAAEERIYADLGERTQRLSLALAHLYQRNVATHGTVPPDGWVEEYASGLQGVFSGVPPQGRLRRGKFVRLLVGYPMAEFLLKRDRER